MRMNRYATLIDPNKNQFEFLVEKIKENIYLTHGSCVIFIISSMVLGIFHICTPDNFGQLSLSLAFTLIIFLPYLSFFHFIFFVSKEKRGLSQKLAGMSQLDRLYMTYLIVVFILLSALLL
jgi:hypothetical protein